MSLEGYNPKDPRRALAFNRQTVASYTLIWWMFVFTMPSAAVILIISTWWFGWSWMIYVLCVPVLLSGFRGLSDEYENYHRARQRVKFLERQSAQDKDRSDS